MVSNKTEDLRNKVAIITGSSMGIGRELGQVLAEHGVKIVLNGRDINKLNKAANDLKSKGAEVIAVPADVRYPEECIKLIDDTIEAFGRIDIIINNAAISTRGSVEEMTPRVFKEVMETNFAGSVYPTKYALEHLKRSNGHVIFINSVAGLCGIPYNSVYCCSKIAQSIFSDALRLELADTGIHVGIVFPSFTQNDKRKKILNPQGEWIYLPERNNVNQVSQKYLANKIVRMIRKRKKRLVMSKLGNVTYYLQRFWPFVIRKVLQFHRLKVREEYTFIGGEKVK